MKTIWAPWRMDYILSDKDGDCIFCAKAKERKDRENYLLVRGKTCFLILNTFPYNSGHLMIAPYRHVKSLELLEDAEVIEVTRMTCRSIRLLQEALHPEGFNLGVNIGEVAGAGVKDHVHLHIVPRWQGDTNFMTTLSETRVSPELLNDTYAKLKRVEKEKKLFLDKQ